MDKVVGWVFRHTYEAIRLKAEEWIRAIARDEFNRQEDIKDAAVPSYYEHLAKVHAEQRGERI